MLELSSLLFAAALCCGQTAPASGPELSVKGAGGKFVADGNLISGTGKLPFNTDGGGLCNNHPANRGGITTTIVAEHRA